MHSSHLNFITRRIKNFLLIYNSQNSRFFALTNVCVYKRKAAEVEVWEVNKQIIINPSTSQGRTITVDKWFQCLLSNYKQSNTWMLWRSVATSGSAFSYLFQNKYTPARTNCVFGYKQFALICFSITAQRQKAKEDERSGSGRPQNNDRAPEPRAPRSSPICSHYSD